MMRTIEESIKSHEAEIIDLNIAQHREQGVNSAGQLMSNYAPYTPLSVFLKGIAGTLTSNNPDIINLHDTGEFHERMELFKSGNKNEYEISSTDVKTDELEEKYSSGKNSIFGLTNENMDYINFRLILPDIEEELFQKVFKI